MPRTSYFVIIFALMSKLFKIILVLFGILLVVVLFNTFTFKSKQPSFPLLAKQAIDEACVTHLSEAVQIKTISYDDVSLIDTAVFSDFLEYLKVTYPLCDSLLNRTVINTYSLLYKWEGSDASLKPVILLGHMDVVPAEDAVDEKWTHPPFSGLIDKDFIWGRGSIDDKVNVIGIMEAVEAQLKEGYKPKRTFYLAFGHDEEIGGREGALKIARYLESKNVKAEFAIDEGLLVTRGVVPGITRPVALVGIAEKGYVSVELSVRTEGGHSSMPPKETSIGILSRAVVNLEDHPLSARISEPVKKFIEYIGPEMPFFSKMAFANPWLFESVIIGKYEKSNAGDAIVRSTTAPTIIKSGVKDNVLPGFAVAVINFRILPGESSESIMTHVKAVIGDERVSCKIVSHTNEPSPIASINSSSFVAIQKSIREVFDSIIITPSIVVGATDARHYTRVAPDAFRFVPIIALPADLKRLHGVNERISIENFKDCIRFYRRLIVNSN